MKKIKTLAIAPYEGLKDLINELAKDRPELEVHTFVADMLDGVEVVKSVQEQGYDAIISRAGTADLIREVSALPVIDIKLNVVDMMRAIKLAQNYFGSFVIVGYKSITDSANLICQLMEYDVEVNTIADITEIDIRLSHLKEKGISLIVGDVVTINHAKRTGFNTILVTSGKESVLNAFNEVIHVQRLISKTRHENLLLNTLLKNANVSVICYNTAQKMVYCNLKQDQEEHSKILEETENLINAVLKEEECQILKKHEHYTVLIKGELLTIEDTHYLAFYVEIQKAQIKLFEQDITFKNVSDARHVNFEIFNSSSESLKIVIENVKNYTKTSSPIIIFGEKGTGKETLANAIYYNSGYKKNPLILINAKYMNAKKWESLFQSEDSLFTNSDFTFFIKDMHLMDELSQNLFELYIRNTYVHKRNRFIFSCITGYSKSFDEGSMLYFIRNELNSLPIIMPTLVERREDIPSLASLFLSDTIIKYGKEVIGFEKDAMKLLQEFEWTNNIDQLRRCVEELIVCTNSYYVHADTVSRLLAYENLPKSKSLQSILDLAKPLDEINRDIINLILTEENFNQSKAAERLGISRSTLWRKIK